MKRINAILILLLVLSMVAGFVSPPAACAVALSGTETCPEGDRNAALPPAVGDSALETNGVTGDPGGAGDGLGADPDKGLDAAKDAGAGAVLEFMLQMLRLLQAAG